MEHSEQTVQAFYAFQARTVRGHKTALGIREGWTAPVAIFDATEGFGEEAWIDGVQSTVLAFRVSGGRVEWLCGRHAGRTSDCGAGVVLQPRGTPNHSRANGAVRFAQIYLSDALIDRVADGIRPGATASGALRDDLVFLPDRDVELLVSTYLATSRASASSLEMEASAILLVSRLLRGYHGFGQAKPRSGGLAPWQLKRACEAMDAHLADDIGLAMLGEIAGCSPTHFSRAFKQSMGVAPFQWLLERRMERAKTLLADGELPLAEVALEVGFAAQAQFTTAFRRVTGTTPGAWRRERTA